jgi:hypothetical protein
MVFASSQTYVACYSCTMGGISMSPTIAQVSQRVGSQIWAEDGQADCAWVPAIAFIASKLLVSARQRLPISSEPVDPALNSLTPAP